MHKRAKELLDKIGPTTFSNNFSSDPKNSIEERVYRAKHPEEEKDE
jgi:hypothetical protein